LIFVESYIAYLDLLGTKNFSGDVETYTQNIQHFYDSINFCSALLKDGDIVAYFSDCSYIQTFSIKNMVDFLRYLREVLMSYNLFFNAAVIKGELDIKNDLDNSRVRGISFNNPAVSKVYLAQDNYKGAGIHLEDAVKEEIKKEEKLVKYLTKSIYLPGLDIQPKAYFDLKFDVKSDKNSQLEYQSTRCIFENALNACLKAKTFGKYYVATLATLINSFDEPALKWNLNKHEFTEAPLIYKVIFDIGKGEGNDNEKYKKRGSKAHWVSYNSFIGGCFWRVD